MKISYYIVLILIAIASYFYIKQNNEIKSLNAIVEAKNDSISVLNGKIDFLVQEKAKLQFKRDSIFREKEKISKEVDRLTKENIALYLASIEVEIEDSSELNDTIPITVPIGRECVKCFETVKLLEKELNISDEQILTANFENYELELERDSLNSKLAKMTDRKDYFKSEFNRVKQGKKSWIGIAIFEGIVIIGLLLSK